MKAFKKTLKFSLSLGLLFAVGYLVTHTTQAVDWWRLRNYEPSPLISGLADRSSMSETGRKLFYVHDPAVLEKESFQKECTVGEATIVLGCYVSRDRIYIYDVTDERLQGVEEVTAAHEMLHAAYERLSPAEKKRVNVLLDDAYGRLTDERLRKNIASYEERDPSVVSNELHSILGTELRQLPAELESYYAKYFTDRSVVVSLAETYADEFQKREDQIAAYDLQLTNLNGEITRQQAELKLQNDALTAERALLEGLRDDASVYNEGVRKYNAKVNTYNAQVNEVKRIIEEYNTIVTKRNEIAVEERDLVSAIDTRAEQL